MSTTPKISREVLKQFRADFEAAVRPLEKKYGVLLSCGSISFSDTYFSMRMTADLAKDGKKVVDSRQFEISKKLIGLRANIGDSYVDKGIKYTIIDIDTKKPMYPVMLEASNGKTYKTSVEAVHSKLGIFHEDL